MSRWAPIAAAAAWAGCLLTSGAVAAPPAAPVPAPAPVRIKLLGFNDFHGQLESFQIEGRPVGGAAVFAAWLRDAARGMEDRTFIVHAGDFLGASPASSNLLKDEPSIAFLNLLANRHCHGPMRAAPRCNIIGTLGNHELDHGQGELARALRGGDHREGPFLERPWRGARSLMVSANVIDRKTGAPWFPAYVIQQAAGVRIAFIGAVTTDTRVIVSPGGIIGLQIDDEAEAVNRVVPQIKERGVRAIVLLIHEGGAQEKDAATVSGKINRIVERLDPEIDVVVSGHTHKFTNIVLKHRGGNEVLVTQAYDKGQAFADITLEIDPRSGDVMHKSAEIRTTWTDEGPGLHPDPKVADLVARARKMVAPRVVREIGRLANDLSRTANAAGESALGSFIADAHRASVGADIGFMNPGGIRAELRAGVVSWGDVFSIHPFGNRILKVAMTGRQILDVLEAQKLERPRPRVLQISGLRYKWDERLPAGKRVVDLTLASSNQPLDPEASYTVAVNDFVVDGGDGHDLFKRGRVLTAGPLDLDALIGYLKHLPQPVAAAIDGRIGRVE